MFGCRGRHARVKTKTLVLIFERHRWTARACFSQTKIETNLLLCLNMLFCFRIQTRLSILKNHFALPRKRASMSIHISQTAVPITDPVAPSSVMFAFTGAHDLLSSRFHLCLQRVFGRHGSADAWKKHTQGT